MSHFRTKPVVIEAFQWDGTIASYDAINRWAGREQMRPKEEGVWRDRVEQGVGEEYFTALIVHALGGDVRAYTGDWIICGVIGELYPCKPDIFAATYEPADGASSSERRDEVTDEKMGLVRLILEGFRDTPNPSIDIALEEIMMTFEQGYIGRPGQARIVKDEDAMTLLIDAESWLYHSTTQEERWPIAAKVRAFVRERRGNDPWRDSQRIETPPTGQRAPNE